MKKLLTLVLAVLVAVGCCFAFTACDGGSKVKPYAGIKKVNDVSEIKAGLICLHDETSTYDKNFIDAFNAACSDMGITNTIIKTDIEEGTACYDAAVDLAEQGCNYIFADSFGHEAYVLQAAEEYPNVQFCHATGTKAHTAGRGNFHNAFASIYEGRYLAGYAAGLKLLTMPDKAVENNFTVGYVGAWQYAEVISGYTSWFLGVRAALAENGGTYTADMKVLFTSSWYDLSGEYEAAKTLIDTEDCVLISQHADSMGAPNACDERDVPNVSYNGSTKGDCEDTYIVSSKINWAPYYKYCFNCMLNGTEIPCDYTGGLDESEFTAGSVCLAEFGKEGVIAAGTEDKLAEIRDQLVEGTRRVFDCSKFTVENNPVTSYIADVNDFGDYKGETEVIIKNCGITYFAESLFRSAPYFNLYIDGIELLNNGFGN